MTKSQKLKALVEKLIELTSTGKVFWAVDYFGIESIDLAKKFIYTSEFKNITIRITCLVTKSKRDCTLSFHGGRFSKSKKEFRNVEGLDNLVDLINTDLLSNTDTLTFLEQLLNE